MAACKPCGDLWVIDKLSFGRSISVFFVHDHIGQDHKSFPLVKPDLLDLQAFERPIHALDESTELLPGVC